MAVAMAVAVWVKVERKVVARTVGGAVVSVAMVVTAVS